MKSQKLGNSISKVEVLNISTHGIWLNVKGREYFLPYEDFPWFKSAAVEDIHDVSLVHSHHLYWKKLDVDLELESLQNIEHYPLKFR